MNCELTGVREAEISRVLHDINDSLGIAIGNLDLAIELAKMGHPDPLALQMAYDGCLEMAALVRELRQYLILPPATESTALMPRIGS